MINEAKMELIKRLKGLIVFQKECFNEGRWEDYDKTENEIQKLERTLSDD